MSSSNPRPNNGIAISDRVRSAFLGAAAGDALGWPNELNSKNADRKSGTLGESVPSGFVKWRRREGGRWYAHEEVVAAGEYSDDTQLLLATSRCVLRESQWWEQLTRGELPMWTAYERGGGGATKRAAEAWLSGREPWGAPRSSNRKQYVEAGGNGVAMRIMPHCARAATADTFSDAARLIVANGVATHGHPRALLGALAYGFSVWLGFRSSGTLGFGALIDEVCESSPLWSAIPDVDDICPKWHRELVDEGYRAQWTAVVGEVLELLSACKKEIRQGVASDDAKLLSDIGCYNAQWLGAGTVAAAAAIYLASRYAAQPLLGLRQAAYARGTDTDTIASMTGGLLGALRGGTEWLEGLDEATQDYRYICGISEALTTGGPASNGVQAIRVTSGAISKVKSQLAMTGTEGAVDLPLGGSATITGFQQLAGAQDGTSVRRWRLSAFGGQDIYVKRFDRAAPRQAGLGLSTEDRLDQSQRGDSPRPRQSNHDSARVMVRLVARDPARLRRFYEEVLGCTVEESPSGCMIGGALFVVHDPEARPPCRVDGVPTVSVSVASIGRVFERVRRSLIVITAPLPSSGERPLSFRCLDPEGNPVEVIQA